MRGGREAGGGAGAWVRLSKSLHRRSCGDSPPNAVSGHQIIQCITPTVPHSATCVLWCHGAAFGNLCGCGVCCGVCAHCHRHVLRQYEYIGFPKSLRNPLVNERAHPRTCSGDKASVCVCVLCVGARGARHGGCAHPQLGTRTVPRATAAASNCATTSRTHGTSPLMST